jgi:hypothetical protein
MVKLELKRHLFPLIVIFIVTVIFWIFRQHPWYNFIYLFFGLLWGAFLLDLDHFLYWYFLKPNLEESQSVQTAIKNKNFTLVLKILEATHKNHTSLIFHHFFFQSVLVVVSLFAFTSSQSVFVTSLLLALNIHLLVDEIIDYRQDPSHLQNWLFAREKKQLPQRYLKHYLAIFSVLALIFFILLVFRL